MKIVAHVDPLVLERELLARVDAAHPRSAPARTLVLVPTRRLAEHVVRRLAGVRPAWLGLRVLHFRRLVLEILGGGTSRLPHVASRLLLEALAARLVSAEPRNPWAAFVERRPGALRRIVETLNDLREAAIEPAAVTACCSGDARGRGLAELYEGYHAALEQALPAGWTDDAGLARAALAHVAAFAEGSPAIFVHGAYELVGVHLDLVHALDRAAPVTFLLPASPGKPVAAYAERHARDFLLAGGGVVEEPDGADTGSRPALAALYDEESRPEPWGSEGRLRFRHVQGARPEVEIAVREALRAIGQGTSPVEIAIAARNLEPFAAGLEEVFEDAGLAATSSLGSPLRREPLVRDFLLLAGVVADDFPRRATAELLRSPRLRWEALLPPGVSPPPGELAESWSREAGVIDGLDDWTRGLASWATPERAADAERLARAVRAVADTVAAASRSWAAHASHLERILDAALGREDLAGKARRAVGGLHEILDDMGRLESLLGETRPIAFREARAWLERAVDGAALPPDPDDGGGIRVLDAMQLRGLTFSHLHFLGLQSGLCPRSPREDPILGDGVRRALVEATGRPLGIKSMGLGEERLLLALVLGSARESIAVSWQRADESGRAKSPSLALREIARLRYGRPDVERLRQEARRLPSHPQQWLEALAEDPGLLSPDEELLLAALRSRDAELTGALERRAPDLAPGLEMLRATQSFGAAVGPYDARVGPREIEAVSVTALETLGRCPLQFFFRHVLGVREPEAQATVHRIAAKELGRGVHALLEQVYRQLDAEGRFASREREALVGRGAELVEAGRELLLGPLGQRLALRLPVLWEPFVDEWLRTLRSFVEEDLARIHDRGLRPAGFEQRLERALDLGAGAEELISARFDRLLEGPSGPVIGDYKRTRRLRNPGKVTEMLKGRALQAPLYWLLGGPGASVELLAIHPEPDPAEPSRIEFGGFDRLEIRESFLDTMRVLARLRREGNFPFHKDGHCRSCPFQQACRRNHPPTIDREAAAVDTRRHERITRKSTRQLDGS